MKFSPAVGMAIVLLAGFALYPPSRDNARAPSRVPPPPPGAPTGLPSPDPRTPPTAQAGPSASAASPGSPSLPDNPLGPPPPSPDREPSFAAFDAWLRRFGSEPPALTRSPEFEAEGIRLARRRREELEDLIPSDPRRAIELSISDASRAALPAAVEALLEQRVSGRGDFEVLCAIPEPGRETEVRPIRRYAVIGERRFAAFVYGQRVNQPTLRDVSLHGIALDRNLALHESPVRDVPTAEASALLAAQPDALCAEGGDHPAGNPLARVLEAYGQPAFLCCPEHAGRFEARLAAAGTGTSSADANLGASLAASPATTGLKRLLFIRVDFSDLQGESFTTARAGDLTRELHSFYQNNSFGRAGFFEIGAGSEVTPVFRMPRTAASYGSNDDAGDLRTDARNAARAAGYVLGNYDYDLTCMKSVPGFGWAGLGFVGAPGAWIRGTSSTGVTAHELGHNYGLNHANYWDTTGPTVTGPGESIEYGDKFDTMGAASAGNNHFNARYKRLLGWLHDDEYAVATTNGTYRIHAHDFTNSVAGSRGLQVFANARTNYWVEFRQRFSSNRWLFNGVGIRWTGRANEPSLLLDTTPDSPREKDDAAVTLGRTFSDPASELHITPIAKGGTTPSWIDVVVQRGRFPDNRPPTLRLVAPILQGSTSSALEFQADAQDPDGDPLAYFWEFGDESLGTNTPSLTHRWSTTGEFVVHCTASDMKGGSARAFVVVRIGSPSTLRVSGRVVADGEPVAGVRVGATSERFTFTDSDGRYTLAGLSAGAYDLTATLEQTAFSPVSFANPVNLQASRTGLDFAAVDIALTRPVTLLAAGSAWRYRDSGTAPAASWIQPNFDDASWNVGPAILGYGGDRETTVVDFGGDSNRKFITTWYRRSFVVEDPSRLANIRIGLLRDDGAAVYLNGRELYRDNLPSGTLTAQTLASSTVGGTDEVTYFERDVEPSRFVAGTNWFAVEIHQVSATSSDTAFDLRLTAEILQESSSGIRLVRPSAGENFTTPGRLVISAAVGELPGSTLQKVEFLADGRPIGTATQAPFTITWSNPPPGDHTLVANAVLADGSSIASTEVVTSVRDTQLNPTFVPRGSVWRFLDSGTAPDGAWNGVAFDDASWAFGPARLGYGEDGEFTVVGFGPNPSSRHVTTWFRHTFEVVDADTVTNLICRLARDDGAVVYLNGQELFRSGMRTGTVTPTLLAQADVRDEAEVTFAERSVSTSGLLEGRNVLAVEVHQASRSSSDLGFDLELVAQRNALPEIPRLAYHLTGQDLRIAWSAKSSDWTLERTASLGASAVWQSVEAAPSDTGTGFAVVLPLQDGPGFFRLRRTR